MAICKYEVANYYGGTSVSSVIWGSWNDTYTVSTSSGTANNIWVAWNSTATTATPSMITYQTLTDTWAVWVGERERSREEIEAEAERERLAAEEYRTLAADAEARAEALLKQNLSERQAAEYAKDQTFTVISKNGKRTYRVRKGWSHNVEVIENDKKIATLCAHPVERVPEFDNMLTQKLMLEHAEEDFLKVANRRHIA